MPEQWGKGFIDIIQETDNVIFIHFDLRMLRLDISEIHQLVDKILQTFHVTLKNISLAILLTVIR